MQIQFCQHELDRMKAAYCYGRTLPVRDPGDAEEERITGEAIVAEMKTRLPAFDIWVTFKSKRLGNEGVSAIKKGAVDDAIRLFREAEELLAEPLYHEARLMAEAAFHTARAYLEYRERDFAGAESRILSALEREDRLENTYGYHAIHIHRIHLVENLLRVYWYGGNDAGAVPLLNRLLAYMSGSSPEGLPGSWQMENLKRIGERTVRSKFSEIFSTFALHASEFSDDKALPLWRDLGAGHASPCRPAVA